MTTDLHATPARALVLGGGGVTGIAWEVGVLTGLGESGVDLSGADAVFGTSAGAFVGAAVASGYDLQALYTAQGEAGDAEVTTAASPEVLAAWYDAFAQGGDDPRAVGAAFGRIGVADPEPVPPAVRRAVVRARLVTTDWPAALRVSAIDAGTGELHVFDSGSGVPLVDAVTASGAVPGVWPLAHVGGRAFVDGGMVSAANASLAAGYGRVVVVAPLAEGYGAVPGAADDVAAMSTRTRALLLAPDQGSAAAIGPNIYDTTRRRVAAEAGRRQGAEMADQVAATWS